MECKAKEKEQKEKEEIAEFELKEKEVGFAELKKEQILGKREGSLVLYLPDVFCSSFRL